MIDAYEDFRVELQSIPPGILDVPSTTFHAISISAGPPAFVLTKRDGRVSGCVHLPLDIDVVPAGTPSYWEIQSKTATDVLMVQIAPKFVQTVAARCDVSQSRSGSLNRFQLRDPQIARLGLLLRDELETGGLGGRLYGESLITALIVRLLHHSVGPPMGDRNSGGGLAPAKLRRVVEYMQEHLGQDITLTEIADTANLSPSQFRLLFKQSTGLAPHQYLIVQRVERARLLLLHSDLTISQIAAGVGFADQSHLTRLMRRLVGVTPRKLRSQR